MTRPVRWLRAHGMIVGPYLLVVLVACATTFFTIRGLDHQSDIACRNLHDGRQVLREVVINATEPGQRVDLTKIPGFDGLDPTTQLYIQNLSSALNATPDQTPLRDRLLALIPPVDC